MPQPEKTSSRIGGIGARHEYFEWDVDASSVEDERSTSVALSGVAPPQYSKDPQILYFSNTCLSDGDRSTSSGSDALSDAGDTSSCDLDTLSSSEDEAVPETKGENEENEDDDEEDDISIDPEETSGSSSSSMSSGSEQWDPTSKKSAVIELNFVPTLRQATKTGHDLSEVFDVRKAKLLENMLVGQKLAVFEEDMGEHLTGKDGKAMEEMKQQAMYWKIRKIVKFMKLADAEGTYLALNALLKCDLHDKNYHTALDDTGCIEVLINLLSVESFECRVVAMEVLDQLTEVNENMVNLCLCLGLPEELTDNLMSSDDQEISACVKLLCNLVSHDRARTVFRKSGIIPKLFQLVHRVSADMWRQKMSDVFEGNHLLYECGIGAIYVLASLMRSPMIRDELHDLGYMTVVIPLLMSKEIFVVRATMECIARCASLGKYRRRFEAGHTIKIVLKYWQSHTELVFRFLFKMAHGVESRKQIMELGGVNTLINFIRDENNISSDPYSFKYALATIHRLSAYEKARDFIQQANLIENLFKIMINGNTTYKLYTAGILSILSIYPENWKQYTVDGRLNYVIELASITLVKANLLIYCLKIIGDLAYSSEVSEIFSQYPDTLSLILSLFKEENGLVVRCAARAIAPLSQHYPEFADEVKSENDSIDVLMERLSYNEESVQAAVCEALGAVAIEDSVLKTYDDMGLASKILPFINAKHDDLKESVCLLISICAGYPPLRKKLGQKHVVLKLTDFLFFPNTHVAIAAVSALLMLSYGLDVMVHLMEPPVIQALVKCASSEYKEIANSAIGCLRNIRQASATKDKINACSQSNTYTEMTKWKFPIQFKPQVIFHYEMEF